MCLLIHKKAGVTFTDAQLADMYKRNQDGFGIMYVEDGMLYTVKDIGEVEDWIAFFRQYEHLESCIHLRMRTHGDIDLENTHPYPIFGFEEPSELPMAMMHNGILSQGNKKDETRSDTWHYIRDVIQPLLVANPAFAFTPLFEELIASHIGPGNKFAIMDSLGNIQIVNKHKGVTWNDTWFSNTYAWSAFDNTLYPGRNPNVVTTNFKNGANVGTTNKNWRKNKQQELDMVFQGWSNEEFNKRFPPAKTTPIPSEMRMLWADCDFIKTILTEDAPTPLKKITDPQIETLISAIGCKQVEIIIEDYLCNKKTDAWLVDMFRDQKGAREYINGMVYKKAAITV